MQARIYFDCTFSFVDKINLAMRVHLVFCILIACVYMYNCGSKHAGLGERSVANTCTLNS